MRRIILSCALLIGCFATIGLKRAPNPSGGPKLIRLSSNEYIGLVGICRVIDDGANAINVTLVSGSTLHLANADDVKAVRDGLARLETTGDVKLFHPIDGVTINLLHVTNIWRQEGGYTFWQTDAQGWSVPKIAMFADVSKRFDAALKSSGLSEDFIQILPHITVSVRHVQHAATVNGELRIAMSNKLWPKVEASEADAAKEALARAAK